jgi:hypothetical protein
MSLDDSELEPDADDGPISDESEPLRTENPMTGAATISKPLIAGLWKRTTPSSGSSTSSLQPTRILPKKNPNRRRKMPA